MKAFFGKLTLIRGEGGAGEGVILTHFAAFSNILSETFVPNSVIAPVSRYWAKPISGFLVNPL